jgi:hypothetical protein
MDIDKPLDEVCLSLLFHLESREESLPFPSFSGNSKLTSRWSRPSPDRGKEVEEDQEVFPPAHPPQPLEVLDSDTPTMSPTPTRMLMPRSTRLLRNL